MADSENGSENHALEEAKRVMARLVKMPPKPHKQSKVGTGKGAGRKGGEGGRDRKWNLTAPTIRFEFRNQRPVDLLDLTSALAAFGETYQDHAVSAGFDAERGNTRLYVREISPGSIIVDLVSAAQQVSWVEDSKQLAAAFLTHFDDIVKFFLGAKKLIKGEPSKREAEQVMKVFEPVAKELWQPTVYAGKRRRYSRSPTHVLFSGSKRCSKLRKALPWPKGAGKRD